MVFKKIYFLVPEPEGMVSGGNIYNRHLIDALNNIGVYTEIIQPSDFPFLLFDKNKKTPVFIDTLYLKDTKPIIQKYKDQLFSVLIVHHLESLYPPKNHSSVDYFNLFEKPLFELIDAFLTSSQFTADYLIKNKIEKPIAAIPPPLAFKTGLNSERVFFPINALMVANLVERKGVLPFLKILSEHLNFKKELNFKINIIGNDAIEPGYANKCKKLIEKNEALKKAIIYHGEQSPKIVEQFYLRSNLFISASFMETYGMALQEAAAFRLAILALCRGNVPYHIKEGANGFLFDGLKGLTKRLLAWSDDENGFTAFSKKVNAPTSNENSYTWQQAAEKVVASFSS